MKTLTITTIILFLLMGITNAQISVQMRAGWAIKTQQPIISPAASFQAYGFSLSPEMIVYTDRGSPANFGLKISYEYLIRDELSIEAGYGRYFNLYSTDKINSFKNGWSNLLFASIHYKRFFIEYGYDKESILSFGMREQICNILN